MGLAISQQIATMMGSQIQVQSEFGKGSTLPILDGFEMVARLRQQEKLPHIPIVA